MSASHLSARRKFNLPPPLLHQLSAFELSLVTWVQAIVSWFGSPVILIGSNHIGCDLLLALAGHSVVLNVFLEASDETRRAVLEAGAELRELIGARPPHRVLEVDVLSHPNFGIEQRHLALVAELLSLLL